MVTVKEKQYIKGKTLSDKTEKSAENNTDENTGNIIEENVEIDENISDVIVDINPVETRVIDWFEKIDINLLIWQIIFVFIVWFLRIQIRDLFIALIKKIHKIKSIGELKFDEDTEQALHEHEIKSETDIERDMESMETEPDIAFLINFIDFERGLRDLYQIVTEKNKDIKEVKRIDAIIKVLIEYNYLDSTVDNVYRKIREVRNQVAHGQRVFSNYQESKKYLNAVTFVKDMTHDALEKAKK